MFDFENGEILLIDKPYQWTSHQVVHHVRKSIHDFLGRKVKTGHAGTLDPLATGVLIILTGKMTKKMEVFQQMSKEYSGIFTLGATTASYDLETKIEKEYPTSHITDEMINAASEHFTGRITQTPPVYSAVKIKGRRAYDYARSGEEVKIKTREVDVYKFEISKIDLPEVEFIIKCSKGTYIRSIAKDFGNYLSSGAYLSSLCRNAIGEHKINDCMHPIKFREFLDSLKSKIATQ